MYKYLHKKDSGAPKAGSLVPSRSSPEPPENVGHVSTPEELVFASLPQPVKDGQPKICTSRRRDLKMHFTFSRDDYLTAVDKLDDSPIISAYQGHFFKTDSFYCEESNSLPSPALFNLRTSEYFDAVKEHQNSQTLSSIKEDEDIENDSESETDTDTESESETAGRLRDFLYHIKKGRIATGESPRFVEHELEWANWICEAAETGVMHVKEKGCKCRPDWASE
ncbi:hypothetical protein K469DRAFT_752617 [Zopfia rhizophila CBS 207.26]|uniref:Uncharacterized protein n=1 Tax=Zopfia rhizophila CBS 207.26 TaxID=1314779 RepID=A0A6A6DQ71_9PEZI|nr:hypothetical protein K469DRAFT_752617 [Zopfia rhizophila CBS 207.26]